MKRLKDLREDHDLKQSDVAKVLGISQQYYQCYESGKNELPLRHCITLARFYNVSLDYLVGLSPIPSGFSAQRTPTMEKYARLVEKLESAEPNVQKAIRLLLNE